MTDRLLDVSALAVLLFVGWMIVTRLHVIYDATVCWGTC